VIVSTSEIPQPHLDLRTTVNGEERQKSNTSDLFFNIPQILEHLSRGTTLAKGTVVMTGTPSGVAAFMKPPAWLETGDVVEVEIGKIGKIKNKMIIK
jgi:2-keto-4-pentenoate hydratase/2-oxohepta-3-ene-1,7-dioic acid hydratase in catechol pathway